MIIIKEKTKRNIRYVLINVCVFIFIFFVIYGITSYKDYTEKYSYELEEIKAGTYAIYNTVYSIIPSYNYEVITVCYDGRIHMFHGIVNICQTNNRPYVEVISRPHKNYHDEITIYIPKDTVEFAEGVGVR